MLADGIEPTLEVVVNGGQFWRFMEQDPKKVARFVFECCEHRRDTLADGGSVEGSDSQLVSTDDEFV